MADNTIRLRTNLDLLENILLNQCCGSWNIPNNRRHMQYVEITNWQGTLMVRGRITGFNPDPTELNKHIITFTEGRMLATTVNWVNFALTKTYENTVNEIYT